MGEAVTLSEDESRHAARVLRLKPGDRVALFDGRGREWTGEIASNSDRVTIRILEERRGKTGLGLTIAAACPKGKRLEFMVQKLAELGVSRFVPVRFERSVVKMTPAKRERLERVASEASKQCGRADVLEIADEVGLSELTGETVFLASPEGSDTLASVATLPATVIIGPEGGLSPAEEEILSKAVRVSLAPTILRIETAAIAAAAVLIHA